MNDLLGSYRAGREVWGSMFLRFFIFFVAGSIFFWILANADPTPPLGIMIFMGSGFAGAWLAGLVYCVAKRLLYRAIIYQDGGFVVEETVLFKRRYRFSGAAGIRMIISSDRYPFARVLPKKKNRFFGDYVEFGEMMGAGNIERMIALVESVSGDGRRCDAYQTTGMGEIERER